jgi:tetratricopeptide (TPR) repeat protein
MLDYDKAVSEYRLAIGMYSSTTGGASWLYAAYNNLARLQILNKNDFAGALALLNRALKNELRLPESHRYTLLKNRGWAYLRLEYFNLAEADLLEAVTLQPQSSAAHCLLAQVIEINGNQQARSVNLQNEWENCVAYAPDDEVRPEEASWVALARERLEYGKPK